MAFMNIRKEKVDNGVLNYFRVSYHVESSDSWSYSDFTSEEEADEFVDELKAVTDEPKE